MQLSCYKYTVIILFFLLTFQCHSIGQQSSNVYANTLTDESNGQHNFQGFQGKNLVLFILPSQHNDAGNRLLKRIDSIAKANKGKLKIIAVPSFEDGYAEDSAHTLMKWYKNALDNSILLSKPVYTHIKSGSGKQDKLFNWLTHSTSNGHFDNEVTGPGTMFLIDKQGKLTGVLGMECNNQQLNTILGQ